MLKNGDSEDHILDDRVDREGCHQSCKQQQTATLPRISPRFLNAVFHEAIFRDGAINLFQPLPSVLVLAAFLFGHLEHPVAEFQKTVRFGP